jgi:hypothetical protein
MPSEESAKANRSIDFIIDRSNHQSKKNQSCEMRSIETGQPRMQSIWNNVDMSLFLDILNILDIF